MYAGYQSERWLREDWTGLALHLGSRRSRSSPRNSRKPTVNVPTVYRGFTPEEAAQGEARSLAEEKWWDVFRDEQLRELIKTALEHNYDVRIAAARILQAQAQFGITRADQFPAIVGSAGATNQRNTRSKFLPPLETSANQVGASLAWDLDFWSKYRRATEAARADLMATEWAGGKSSPTWLPI